MKKSKFKSKLKESKIDKDLASDSVDLGKVNKHIEKQKEYQANKKKGKFDFNANALKLDYGSTYVSLLPPTKEMGGIPFTEHFIHFLSTKSGNRSVECINETKKFKGQCPVCKKAEKFWSQFKEATDEDEKKSAEKSARKYGRKKRYKFNVYSHSDNATKLMETPGGLGDDIIALFEDYPKLCDLRENIVIKVKKKKRAEDKPEGPLNIEYSITPIVGNSKYELTSKEINNALKKRFDLTQFKNLLKPEQIKDIMAGKETTFGSGDDDEDEDTKKPCYGKYEDGDEECEDCKDLKRCRRKTREKEEDDD